MSAEHNRSTRTYLSRSLGISFNLTVRAKLTGTICTSSHDDEGFGSIMAPGETAQGSGVREEIELHCLYGDEDGPDDAFDDELDVKGPLAFRRTNRPSSKEPSSSSSCRALYFHQLFLPSS